MNVKVSLEKLSKRAGFAAGAVVTVASAAPVLLTTHGGLLALALVFLAGIICIAPGSTGLVSPVNPESVSVAQKLALVFAAFVNAPKARREAQIAEMVAAGEKAGAEAGQKIAAQIVQDVINRTGQFTPEQLGQEAVAVAGTVGVAVLNAVEASQTSSPAGTLGG